MRCRALLLGCVVFGLALGFATKTTIAQRRQAQAAAIMTVPALSEAESGAAFAPVIGAVDKTGKDSAVQDRDRQAGPRDAVALSFNAAELAAANAKASTRSAVAVLSPTQESALPVRAPSPPAAAPAGSDRPAAPTSQGAALAERVHDELLARFSVGPDGKIRLADVASFYTLRDNRAVWTDNGSLTPFARAALDRLARAQEDGLDPRAYRVDELDALTGQSADPAKVADVEIAISTALLTYARHAMNGRVAPSTISHGILASVKPVDPALTLASIAIAADPARILDEFNPLHPQYLALKGKLAEIRAAAVASQDTQPVVPPGPTLRVGMSDARVAVLRTRLGLTMIDGDVYDDALAEAVRSFQKHSKLKVTGTLGPQTLAALNGGVSRPRVSLENEIIANMERWRWLPRELGVSHVLVNVPEYRLRVMVSGLQMHESRVIVGKPETPTPIFSDVMQFVVLNPSWHVPQSIIRKEYLPRLAEDPDYLARRGFIVTYHGNQMEVRQPPGDENALGHIKFMFPNNFSVYLHDTSTRGLFAREKRAFSHGCVRVDDPYRFAEIVMGAEHGWTEERVRKSVGGRERRVDLAQTIPVHISYFTAFVDDFGEVKRFDDVYGYDHLVLAALGLAD
jgi:murein L,D-transpeptidase YcbB/YkuD